MKSTVKLKLHIDKEQHQALLQTMLLYSDVCNFVSNENFKRGKLTNKTRLQKVVYNETRASVPEAPAQMVIRAVAKVATSYLVSVPAQIKVNKIREEKGYKGYKLIEPKPNFFKPTSSVDYDLRLMSFFKNDSISLWTPTGRIKVNYTVPFWFRERLANGKPVMGTLTMKSGKFWLHLSITEHEPEIEQAKHLLGIDQGQVYLASDSTGEQFEGDTLKKKCEKYHNRRKSLSKSKFKKKTRSKERAWNRINKKENRFRTDVNHQISKKIVNKAKGTGSAIVLENLTDFFEPEKVRRERRYERRSWSFSQLLQFILYKAKRAGVEVILVNPAYTSQECSVCGYTNEKNRLTQEHFLCKKCGHSENADINAAKVIALRGKCQLSQLLNGSSDCQNLTVLTVLEQAPPFREG